MDLEMGKSVQSNKNHGESGMIIDENLSATVDWRGRPSNPNKHGGMRAAVFVLGLQAFEIMAIAAVGNNLITYVINEMHFPLSKAANIVTNFIGTIFLLALFGGYLSDSYLGSFWTMLIFGFVELSGFILLSVQAHLPQLKPAMCNMLTQDSTGQICEEAKGIQAMTNMVKTLMIMFKLVKGQLSKMKRFKTVFMFKVIKNYFCPSLSLLLYTVLVLLFLQGVALHLV